MRAAKAFAVSPLCYQMGLGRDELRLRVYLDGFRCRRAEPPKGNVSQDLRSFRIYRRLIYEKR